MSAKLESDLRIYMSYLDTLVPTIAADQLVEPVVVLSPAPASPQPSPRPGRLVSATAAAAAIVLLVGTLIVISSGSTNDPAPVATTPPIGSVSSLSWSRVPHDDAVFSGSSDVWNGDVIVLELSMRDVTVGGPGLVAVGIEEWPDTIEAEELVYIYGGRPTPSTGGWPSPHAVVWTSVDGTTWTRLPHNDAVFGNAVVEGVITGGPGLIAVGRSLYYAVVWTSPDGTTWSRLPRDEAAFFDGAMTSVTPFGSGYVAVGSTADEQTVGSNAVVWTSPDGITWSRAPLIERASGETIGEGMSDVVAGSAGGLVAIGWEWSDREEHLSPPVWNSSDGITWSRLSDDEAVFVGGGISVVLSGGPGFIAVGSVGSDGAVWTSPDGITWSRAPHDEAVFRGAEISSVTRGGPGFVAVGSVGEHAAAWTSVDGITWSRVPHDEAIFGDQPGGGMSSVVAFGSEIVAVGDSGGDGDRDAAVWIARVEGP